MSILYLDMAKTIGVISVKGGVGKTTLAAALATDLANHYKKKVLLVDGNVSAPNLGLHMDIVEHQGSIQEVLEGKKNISEAIHSRYGVDVIPGDAFYRNNVSSLKLKDKLSRVKKNYDYIVLDSSPNLNDEILGVMLASDALFVVTTPDYPTLSCSLQAAKLAKQRGRPIAGLILNKIRDPAFELTLKDMEHVMGIPVVARIPDEKVHVKSLFTRMPTTVHNKKSKFSREVNSLNSAITGESKRSNFKDLFDRFRKENINRQVLRENFYTNEFAY